MILGKNFCFSESPLSSLAKQISYYSYGRLFIRLDKTRFHYDITLLSLSLAKYLLTLFANHTVISNPLHFRIPPPHSLYSIFEKPPLPTFQPPPAIQTISEETHHLTTTPTTHNLGPTHNTHHITQISPIPTTHPCRRRRRRRKINPASHCIKILPSIPVSPGFPPLSFTTNSCLGSAKATS